MSKSKEQLSVTRALMMVLFDRRKDGFQRIEPRGVDMDAQYQYESGAKCLFEGTGPNCTRIFITKIYGEEYLAVEKLTFDPDTDQFAFAKVLGYIRLGDRRDDAMNFTSYVKVIESLAKATLW